MVPQVGISPTGAASLRNTSLRNLSAEEKKFANTVVATSSGRDVVMLGAAGRQKRERKMPSRYATIHKAKQINITNR